MTELKINGVSIPIEGTTIALTLSAFKLDNPGGRKGSYSNVFEVAKSNEVREALESAELVTSLTAVPYQRNAAEIIVDGMPAVVGSAVLEDAGQTYRIYISAGNSDFFKALGSIRLTDVDLSEFDHDYNGPNVTARRGTLDGFVYPNIDYGFFEYADLAEETQPFRFFHPSFWARTIIERACDSIGYKLKGAILDTLPWRRMAVLCRGAVADLTDSLAQYRHEIDYNKLTEATQQKISFPDRVKDRSGLYAQDFDAGQFVYTPNVADPEAVRFEFSITGKVITNLPRRYTNATVWIDLLVYDETDAVVLTMSRSVQFENRFFGIFDIYRPPANGTLERDINFTYPSTRDDSEDFLALIAATPDLTALRFGWQVRSNRPDWGLKFLRFENLEFSMNQVPRGGARIAGPNIPITVRASNVLPKGPTVGDLLLLIANLEGIVLQADEATKEVATARLDDIRRRKADARDWSAKLDLTDEPRLEYRVPGFAQRNFYRMAADDKDPNLEPGTGEGLITVADVNLESERALFDSKFAPVPVRPTFSNARAMGVVFTGEKYDFDGFVYTLKEDLKIQEFAPRVAILSEGEVTLEITLGGASVNFEVNESALSFERALANNYNALRGIVDRTKIVNALFLLDREDISGLDFTRPVFVEYFGEFFYIDEIKQFKLNRRESCEVRLVRI
jgi:hypothetical protein